MREKLLLHVCCAPCAVNVIRQLMEPFDLAVYFFNPNIFPEDEYLRRQAEVKNFCDARRIAYYEEKYRPKDWLDFIRGYEKEPERGFRCDLCFLLRLGKAAQFAKDNGFAWFSTTLSAGRQKNSLQVLNAGRKVEGREGVKFYDYDFKKNYGAQVSDWLAKELGFYRQKYCGCVFSRPAKYE